MIVTLRRTGGFAGLHEVLGTVDTATLGGEAQRALAVQVQELTRLSATPATPGADLFHYEVDIREQGQPLRTLVIVDEGDPEAPVLRSLTSLMETMGLAVP